jgi:hypothetical protein
VIDEEFDPRVHIENLETGERTKVRRGEVKGLDAFIDNMPRNTELPPETQFQAWQEGDENHPIGSGRRAYRVVYKTIRTAPTTPVGVVSSNCRVLFVNGRVTWGEPRFGRALAWRRPDRFLLPEWGRLLYQPLQYIREYDPVVPLQAHQETSAPMNYVEIIYVMNSDLIDDTHGSQLSEARAGISSLLASLDLSYGPRFLGVRITEEIGEVFTDWHWNRRLDGPTVALEAQAEFRYMNADLVLEHVGAIFTANAERSEEERSRLRVASQWYWRADAEVDAVQAYIALWLTIESLEMQSANIAPVKETIVRLSGSDRESVATAAGRLYGLRSMLVHGKTRSVSAGQLNAIRSIAHALLEYRLLGAISDERRSALASAVLLAENKDFAAR